MTGHKILIVPVLAQVMQQHIKATSKQPNPYNLLFHKVDVSVIDPKQNMGEFSHSNQTRAHPQLGVSLKP